MDVRVPRIKMGANTQMKIREWAAQNAYTLIVMSVFFTVTWVIIIVANVWTAAHGK